MVRRLKSIEKGQTDPSPGNSVVNTVSRVIEEVKLNGDAAVRRYSQQFDSWAPASFRLSDEEIAEVIEKLDPQVVEDIKEVQSNVRKFAMAQRNSIKDFELEIQPGVFLGQKNNPIDTVGW